MQNNVQTHSMIIGELSCGALKDRGKFLLQLGRLPKAIVGGRTGHAHRLYQLISFTLPHSSPPATPLPLPVQT